MNSFDLHPATLPGQTTDIKGYLHELFTPGTNEYQQLKYEIQREYRSSGSPEVTRMAFDRAQSDTITGHGSFRVIVDVNFTFGCEDVQTDKSNQTSDWTFEVDHQAQLIHFYGSPYIDSRTTADEF